MKDNTVMTVNLYDAKEMKALVKDVRQYFDTTALMDDCKFRRRVITLFDGYYLSVLTGSHICNAVEVALMKDGKPVLDYDFAIIDFDRVGLFLGALMLIEAEGSTENIVELWDDARWI